MYRLMRTILTMFLAGIFLLSFTGIRLLLHECMSCDSSDLYLFAKVETCCSTHSSDLSANSTCCLPVKESPTCCSSPSGSENECCNDEVVYLVKDFEFSNDRQQVRLESLAIVIPILLNKVIVPEAEQKNLNSYINYSEPPPDFVGREFILFSHQIKIG